MRMLVGLATIATVAAGGVAASREPVQPAQRAGADPAPGAVGVAALRRPARATDAVRGGQSVLIADGAGDARGARRVVAHGGRAGWLMPGRGGSICYLRDGFLGCPGASYIDDRGFSPMLGMRDGEYDVGGIASDAVRKVDVSFENGQSVEVPVADNVVWYHSTVAPTRVHWQGPRGPESMAFPTRSLAAMREEVRRER
jgi:hypothetical protein